MDYVKRILLLFVIAVFPMWNAVSAHDSAGNVDMARMNSVYKEWSKKSSEQLLQMGNDFFSKAHEYDRAMVCYTIITNRYKENMSDKEKMVCLEAFNKAGYLCVYHYYDYDHAYDMLFHSVDMCDKFLGDNDQLCYTYLICGNMFTTCGIHYDSKALLSTALDYFQKSLELSRKQECWEIYIKAYIYLTSFVSRRSADQLNKLTRDDVLNVVPKDTPNYEAFVGYFNAMKSFSEGDYAKAREYFYSQIGKVTKTVTPYRYRTLSLSMVAQTFEMENKLDSAIAKYQETIPIARRYNMIDVMAANWVFIANDYKKKGDDSNYMEYYKKYVGLKDSLLTVSGLDQVGEKHFLTAVKQETEHAEELHSRNVRYFLFAVMLAIIAVISTFTAIVVRRKNKLLDERNRLLYERVHEIVLDREEVREPSPQKYQSSTLTEEDKERLKGEISSLMSQPEVICRQDFTIEVLSQMVGTNSRYVSQVVNECYGKNFNTLLSDQRVKEACKRFDDTEKYGNLTIEAVAMSVGFRSRNTLINAFKRVTGLTPSEYQRASRLEREEK